MIITDTVASKYLPFTTSFEEILNSLYKGSIPDSSPTMKGYPENNIANICTVAKTNAGFFDNAP